MAEDQPYALFHAIASAEDARVRREVVALGLKPLIDFRNVVEYPEHAAELRALGGGATPAFWDGERLHQGAAAAIAALRAIIPPRP